MQKDLMGRNTSKKNSSPFPSHCQILLKFMATNVFDSCLSSLLHHLSNASSILIFRCGVGLLLPASPIGSKRNFTLKNWKTYIISNLNVMKWKIRKKEGLKTYLPNRRKTWKYWRSKNIMCRLLPFLAILHVFLRNESIEWA